MSIEIASLTKEFPVSEGIEVAVDDISVDIGDDEFFTLVGPSGCGKTTTLRCIAGLETPTSGTIRFDDVDVTEVPPNKREIAMMFQNIALYPHMDVIDNIAYPLKVRNVDKEERYDQAREAAEIMEVGDLLDKYPGDISGGQRQRCALARTLVIDPAAFLMDEPLSDLDAKLKIRIRKEIQQLHKQLNVPFVYVTHDQEEAMTMSDRIGVMNNGIIEQVGTPRELYDEPNNEFVAKFIGNPTINMLSGEVSTRDNGTATVVSHDVDFDFELDSEVDLEPGHSVKIGFRPENVNLGRPSNNGNTLEGVISLLEPLGSADLATLEGPNGELRVTIDDRGASYEENEEVNITPETSKMYLFDGESGERIATGLN